jgi:hypothetical protein
MASLMNTAMGYGIAKQQQEADQLRREQERNEQRGYTAGLLSEQRDYNQGLLGESRDYAEQQRIAAAERGAPAAAVAAQQADQTLLNAQLTGEGKTIDNQQATNAAIMADENLERRLAGLPPIGVEGKTNMMTFDRQGGQIERAVADPQSSEYWGALDQVQAGLATVKNISELKSSIAQYGTEFTGPESERQDALAKDALVAYGKSKGLGALSEADLEIALGPIPNPSTLGANLRATAGTASPWGILDAAAGAMMGKEGGAFGITTADVNQGFNERYNVIIEQVGTDLVNQITQNPLLLDQLTDAELRQFPPDLLAPIMPYLNQAGRDPYARN